MKEETLEAKIQCLLVAMKAAKLFSVVTKYMGGGDSGSPTESEFYDNDGQLVICSHELHQLADDVCWLLIDEAGHSGFWNNEGGEGTVVFSVTNMAVTITHSNREEGNANVRESEVVLMEKIPQLKDFFELMKECEVKFCAIRARETDLLDMDIDLSDDSMTWVTSDNVENLEKKFYGQAELVKAFEKFFCSVAEDDLRKFNDVENVTWFGDLFIDANDMGVSLSSSCNFTTEGDSQENSWTFRETVEMEVA